MKLRMTVLLSVVGMAGLAACLAPMPKTPTGAEDFAAYCAVCHGAGGRGDGEMAAMLDRRPADLTRLARRKDGEFPATRVMAKIWGYTGGQNGTAVMPNFGPLLAGETVPYDGGDGIETPTPLRLVQLAEYVKSLGG